MAASPLAAALLGGQQANAFALDPAMVQAQPDIALGQSMIQQGLSTAPASPWQALARVAQTGAGTYLQHEALGTLAKAYAHSSENAAATLPEGHPLKAALLSSDPVIRMQGLQAYQKALTLLSEPSNIEPGGQRFVGNRPIAENTNPQSPEGKLAVDVERAAARPGAGGVPAAPPPNAGVPLNPPRIQPGGIESVTGMSPPVPAPVAPPAGGAPSFNDRYAASRPTSVPGNPLQAAIDTKAATEAATERAKAGVQFGDLLEPAPSPKKGPGGTEALTTTHGTLIPPVADQASWPKNPKELEGTVANWNKTKENWNSGIQAGYQAEQRLNTIAQTFKTMQTGYGAEQKAQVGALLKSIGVNLPESIMGDPAKVETAIHENYVETLQQLKATTPRFTQMEFRALSENKEHPNLQPEANLTMLSEDIGQLRQARDIPRDFAEAQKHGWRDPISFEQSWMRQNPLKGYVEKVRGEIGPLKGMEGNTGQTKTEFPGGAPQMPAAPRITSKADYDALPKGKPYMAPDGSIRTKQ